MRKLIGTIVLLILVIYLVNPSFALLNLERVYPIVKDKFEEFRDTFNSTYVLSTQKNFDKIEKYVSNLQSGCFYYSGSTYIAPTGGPPYTITTISFEVTGHTKYYDIGEEFNTATGYFTAKTGGVYLVEVHAQPGYVAPGRYIISTITANYNSLTGGYSTDRGICQDYHTSTSTFETDYRQFSGVFKLQPNDTLCLNVYHDHTSAIPYAVYLAIAKLTDL